MIEVKVLDETAPLEAVVFGTANSFGGTPTLENTYDPKSREHIKAGTFPVEPDLVEEMEAVAAVFEKHNVQVYRPELIEDYNQIFARDISFVIADKLVVPEITPMRSKEVQGIKYIIDQVENVIHAKEHERMEGGDVMPWRDHLFVGYAKEEDFNKYQVARTNEAGVAFLERNFPNFTVKAFELNKSDEDPKENALHLDCCFQPVGKDKAVIHKPGFKNEEDYQYLVDFFGAENVFEITKQEMYDMNSNFFSISPEVIISDSSFERLNTQLEAWGIQVEKVKYREVAKMEGLLRCSTMPLRRKY